MARIRELDIQHVQTEPVDTAAVMEEVYALLRGEAEKKEQTVDIDVAPELPPVSANEDHLKAIWTNLISNAIKYTPDGGRIRISIERNSDQRFVVGTVQDTGIGIDTDSLPHIFDEFFRTDKAKEVSARGTGLGLSITKRLVETYGGHIDVRSELGKGSTFSFALLVAH